jgi:hypothetical protein
MSIESKFYGFDKAPMSPNIGNDSRRPSSSGGEETSPIKSYSPLEPLEPFDQWFERVHGKPLLTKSAKQKNKKNKHNIKPVVLPEENDVNNNGNDNNTPPEQPSLSHAVIVEGVVRIIKFMADLKPNQSVDLGELYKIGTVHTQDEREMDYIFEFIKDGINFSQKTLEAVMNNDYSTIWIMTNRYLQSFGFEPQKPIEIKV